MMWKTACRLVVLWTLLTAVARGGEPVRFAVDMSANDSLLSTEPMRVNQGDLCAGQSASQPAEVLAAAVVIYARDWGASLWGHSSVRFLICQGGALDDVEFEYYRFSPSSERFVRRMHGEERDCPMGEGPYDFVQDADYLRSLQGTFFLHRNVRSIDCGHFTEQLSHNREIYEIWLPLSPQERAALYARNLDRYNHQLDQLIAREPLEVRYGALTRNCTWHLRQDLPQVRSPAALFPMFILRTLLREPVELAVTYPSEHALLRLAEAAGGTEALAEQLGGDTPLTMARLRPIVRSRRGLDPALSDVAERAAHAQVPVILDHLSERESDVVSAP